MVDPLAKGGRARLVAGRIAELDFRTYTFARQTTLLLAERKYAEVAERGLKFITTVSRRASQEIAGGVLERGTAEGGRLGFYSDSSPFAFGGREGGGSNGGGGRGDGGGGGRGGGGGGGDGGGGGGGGGGRGDDF